MAERIKSSVGAFATALGAQDKIIVVNLDALDHDNHSDKPKGAQRFLPRLASHEILHTLGFDHPRGAAKQGEGMDTRSIDQVRADIASNISSSNLLGKLDAKTGRHVITYSFGGNPGRIPVITGITVERMRHLGETKDDAKDKENAQIKEAMREAFAEISSVSNVVFKESDDVNDANIRIFAGTISPSTDSAVSLDGGRNPLTDRSTVMSYNIAEPDLASFGEPLKRGVFKILAPGDVHALQKTYGLPPEDESRRVVTPLRLVSNSGVLWDHKKLVIKLTEPPKLGAVTYEKGSLSVDMGAPTFAPAITGTLKDKDGKEWRVSQHVGHGASIAELDATGSEIGLEVTGGLNARITPNAGATVKLNRRNNQVMLGAGKDTVTFLKGFGNVVSGMTADDAIASGGATKVHLEHWKEGEAGTLMSFIGDDGARKGSLFVKGKSPQEVTGQLKGLTVLESYTPVDAQQAAALDPTDYDITLDKPPGPINFGETKDTLVTAKKAAGFTLRNFNGAVAIKMTKAEFESRRVSAAEEGYYEMSFRDGEQVRALKVQKHAKIAVVGDDGKIVQTVVMRETLGGPGNVKEVEASAISKDAEMEKAPPMASFTEEKDILVSAKLAAGKSVSNMGKGGVVIAMTQPEYESRTITPVQNGYQIAYRDAEGMKQISVQETAKIAVTGPDGKMLRVVTMKDAIKEFELDLALKNGTKSPLNDVMHAKLPRHVMRAVERTA